MDNKNEKTFSDLFSSSVLDNEEAESLYESKNIFDSCSINDSQEVNSAVSFCNINDSVLEKNDQLNSKEDNLFFANVNDKVVISDNSVLESDIFKEANQEASSVDFFEDNIEKDNLKESINNEFVDFNVVQEKKIEVANKDVNIGNLDNVSLNKENQNVIEENEKVLEFTTDDVNLFFDNGNVTFENNISLDKDEVGENNIKNTSIESINDLVEKKKIEKEVERDNVESVSVSPFFQQEGVVKEEFKLDIFDDNKKISFDQTKNVNSKLDKLDLSNSKHFNVKMVNQKPSLFKFLVGVVSYAFFIFLVLVLVTLLAYVLDIKIRAAKGDYSSPTFNAYVVLTGSMLPEIQVKDVVVTKKVDVQSLNVGDVITFASSDSRFLGTIITHRIIKKNQDKDGNVTFQTQGDNNNVADSALVQPNNIYGKVILKIPKLGYLQDFLATQGGWIIVILFPCMAVISYDIVKLIKGIKKKKNRINVIK